MSGRLVPEYVPITSELVSGPLYTVKLSPPHEKAVTSKLRKSNETTSPVISGNTVKVISSLFP